LDKDKRFNGSSSYFLAEDKVHDKSNYHGWKMSLDLTLEGKEVMDYVQGKIPEPIPLFSRINMV